MNKRGLILLAAALLALGAMMALGRDALALFRRGAQQAMAGPFLAVIAGGHMFLFDAGEGAGETLALMGLPAARIEGVFLSHFH